MYKKSKNKLLFVIFILIILLIIGILVFSVYRTKNKNLEQYKISSNNIVYDENYSYLEIDNESLLKKEWDNKYYLYLNKGNEKYSLGEETVIYDKSRNQVSAYGNIYQVYTNGDISEKSEKTTISNVSDFQFFKLSDRKYLMIGSDIKGEGFSTSNYLVISIDKAGNALLVNNSINIKTINPLVLSVGDNKFDVANEKLIINDNEIDLKKINGSTNEYVKKDDVVEDDNKNQTNNNTNTNNNGNNNTNNNGGTGGGSQIYNDIINQIINLSGLVSNNKNKTNLYKNISLRSVTPGASYLDVNYSIIDPEEKYLSVFLAVKDSIGNINYHYLNKQANSYRITGLVPNNQYEITINYISYGTSESSIADSIKVLTSNDPTLLRITKIVGNQVYYKVKMYNEYAFKSATIDISDCDGNSLTTENLDIDAALSVDGYNNFINLTDNIPEYICLKLTNVKDSYDTDIDVNSYHKIKFK